MLDNDPRQTAHSRALTSDGSLVMAARAGDRDAFAVLWQRHARSGLRVARQFTSSIDADDLVSEAYARIYQRVLAGGGPDGAFRPYLYTTIRNLASRWGGNRRDVNVNDIDDFEDLAAADDPTTAALDRTLTVRAFRALPDRWQSVLWYTEVEGMDPHEVAPILGLTANGVAALSYRAREGLRKAWLQAHVSDASASGECQWSIARFGDYARDGLSARDRTRLRDHLATCARCSIISEEVDEVGSRLALVLLPLLLGGIGGGGLLATLAPASTPALVASSSACAVPSVTGGLIASAITVSLIGALTVALVVSGGHAAGATTPQGPEPAPTSITQPYDQSERAASTLTAAAPIATTSSVWIPSVSVPSVLAAQAALDTVTGSLIPRAVRLGSALIPRITGGGTTVDRLVTGQTDSVDSLVTAPSIGALAAPDCSAYGGPLGVTNDVDPSLASVATSTGLPLGALAR